MDNEIDHELLAQCLELLPYSIEHDVRSIIEDTIRENPHSVTRMIFDIGRHYQEISTERERQGKNG